MDSTLVIIGLSHHTAPLSVRERLWLGDGKRYEALISLGQADGIDEIVILSNSARTEFILWASDVPAAANAVRNYLATDCGLRLCDWELFYRLLADAALAHLFRVATGLDSCGAAESEPGDQLESAWKQAQKVGTNGRLLDMVLRRALGCGLQLIGSPGMRTLQQSVSLAANQIIRQELQRNSDIRVLVLGSALTGTGLLSTVRQYAGSLTISGRNKLETEALASRLDATLVPYDRRWQVLAEADVVVSCSACPHVILTKADVERIMRERQGRRLCLFDASVPRDIDPAAAEIEGVFLCDLDQLEKSSKPFFQKQQDALLKVEAAVVDEVRMTQDELRVNQAASTVVALRSRLQEICGAEMEAYCRQLGPVAEDQRLMLEGMKDRISQRIASLLVRELKGVSENVERDRMTTAVHRLFHLEEVRETIARSQN